MSRLRARIAFILSLLAFSRSRSESLTITERKSTVQTIEDLHGLGPGWLAVHRAQCGQLSAAGVGPRIQLGTLKKTLL